LASYIASSEKRRGAAATLAWSKRMTLLETLEIDLPIIQAPMAGVSSPAMA
jgi:hypothetical protein